MRNNRPGEASFSLVEALCATAIMGIAVTSILATFSASLLAGRAAEDYALASSMMTELRAYVRTNQFSPLMPNQGTFTEHPEFSWTATYTQAEYADLYQVDLIIQWARGDREYQSHFVTYHYQPAVEETDETGAAAGEGT
ncbi:MAG: hypothetical protein GC154_20650 [bacterium]|nr:hypothetical protein [bacterium]